MADRVIIDALFSIPKNVSIKKISDCVPFSRDLIPLMNSSGIAGAVLALGNCVQCQHRWNCADRRTDESANVVTRNPKRLSGLAAYDPLRIGESLRWIDESITKRGLAGAYLQAECCISGLDSSRMYPVYGECAKLRSPVVIDFPNRERWKRHRPQVELVAADFPELDILLSPPPNVAFASLLPLIQRFPRVSFLLRAQQLLADQQLCEYANSQGLERVLFRSSANGWPAAVGEADMLPLGQLAKRAYLFENAARLFKFPAQPLALETSPGD
jgi:predicted TIM-barrel fold metal-dependent hydrolase